ncbi:MAG: hypothetical protein MGF17_14440 [Trichodesmium sp. MAG_R04]|nr:hypothetical protein [Trichodesmium sp. MAG_R04]
MVIFTMKVAIATTLNTLFTNLYYQPEKTFSANPKYITEKQEIRFNKKVPQNLETLIQVFLPNSIC